MHGIGCKLSKPNKRIVNITVPSNNRYRLPLHSSRVNNYIDINKNMRHAYSKRYQRTVDAHESTTTYDDYLDLELVCPFKQHNTKCQAPVFFVAGSDTPRGLPKSKPQNHLSTRQQTLGWKHSLSPLPPLIGVVKSTKRNFNRWWVEVLSITRKFLHSTSQLMCFSVSWVSVVCQGIHMLRVVALLWYVFCY